MHTRKELLEFATRCGGLGIQGREVARLLRLARKYGRLQASRAVRPLTAKEITQVFHIQIQVRSLLHGAGLGLHVYTFSDRITIAGIPVPA